MKTPLSICLMRQGCAAAAGLSILAATTTLMNAQSPPAPVPPPPLAAPPQAAPPSGEPGTVEGTVAQYLTNPDGNVDGLLLSSNAIVRVPPHLGEALAQVIHPQDRVKVEGFTEYAGTIRASTVTNLGTQRAVTDTPPAPGAPLPAPNPAARQPLSASGTVRVLIHAPRGEVNGVVLNDGTTIHVPPAGQPFASVLQQGQALAATGFGTTNAYGRSLEATAVGLSPDQLQPVIADNAPAAPPAPPAGRPPRGPR